MSGPSREISPTVDAISGGSLQNKAESNKSDTREYSAKIRMFRGSIFALMAKKEPNIYSLYQSEKARIFSAYERRCFDLLFLQSAPIEHILGKKIQFMSRSKMHQEYNGLANRMAIHVGSADNTYRFFLRPDEISFEFATMKDIKGESGRSFGNPTPIGFKDGKAVYQLESREQILVRQLSEGKYLFGDIGGLVGGAAFWTSHEVFGVEFDDSVAIGKMASDVASFASSAAKARSDNKKLATGLNPNTKPSTISIQPHRSRAQANNEKTFDVVSLLPKPRESAVANQVMKEVLKSIQ